MRAKSPGYVFKIARVVGAWMITLAAATSNSVASNLDKGVNSTPLVNNSGSQSNVKNGNRFTSHKIEGFVHAFEVDHPLSYLYQTGAGCGGIAVGDVDGDDRPDLFLVNGPGKNKLYRQTSSMNFSDVTKTSEIHDPHNAWGVGATMFDFDNDGDLDIYVCNYDAPNSLYENNGQGKFRDVAREYGLDIVDACYLAAPCDYDRDGDLDLYLLTNRYYLPGSGNEAEGSGVWKYVNGEPALIGDAEKYFAIDRTRPGKPQAIELGRRDYLFRNEGAARRRFTNTTDEAGIRGRGDGLSATWWDYDDDGWTDLYVGNDFSEPDRLYRNNRDGTFTDVADTTIPHCPWFSMGADVGDLNGDGRFDFLIADMSATSHFKQKVNMGDMGAGRLLIEQRRPIQIMRNALYLNSGTSRFLEAAYLAGLASSDWTWTVKIADLDNDGCNDVFFTNGMARNFTDSDIRPPANLVGADRWDFFKDKPPRKERNLAYRAIGPLQFEDVSKRWGLDHFGMSYAAAHCDFDRDGDLDLVVANFDEGVLIYENLTSKAQSILIHLRPANGNHAAIGATAKLTAGGVTQVRQLQPVSGYLSSNDPVLHFGLGSESIVDELVIRWPNGNRQTIHELKAGNNYTIAEKPDRSSVTRTDANESMALLSPYDLGIRILHRETEFDDFLRQPLLPNKLSQIGPPMAWGDIDGDGDEDLFLGQGAGWMSMIYRRSSEGRFNANPQLVFAADDSSEDMGAVFFDVDGDDDLDLYVASGGNEFERNDSRLRDRLYLNDGTGTLNWRPRKYTPSYPVAMAQSQRPITIEMATLTFSSAAGWCREPTQPVPHRICYATKKDDSLM